MIQLHMNSFGKKLCILGIYAISDDENAVVKADFLGKLNDAVVKEDFFGKLNEVIVEIGNSREILIAGDFKSRTGKKINNLVVGPLGEQKNKLQRDQITPSMEQSPFLRSQNFFSLSRNSPPFMQLEGSLPRSQEPATCPHPQPYQSTPRHTFNFLKSQISDLRLGFSKCSLCLRLPHKTLHTTHFSLTGATYLANSLFSLLYIFQLTKLYNKSIG